jgi:hypothetical protein
VTDWDEPEQYAGPRWPVGEDLEVPLFSLADVFPQFRTAGGGGLRPAHYRVSVAALASVPSARRPLELEELDVR